MDVEFGNSSMNFSKIEKFLNSLKKIELNSLLILPELFLTGYNRSEIEKTAFENEKSMSLSKLISMADQYNIAIFGSIAEKFNDNYYNTAVFITKEGIMGAYRKIHLFGPMGEKNLFSSGSNVETVTHQSITFGLSICYDLRFPLMYQKMMDEGTEIVLVVAEWPIARVNHWSALLKARAIENQSFVIGLNRVGNDPEYTYGGHSAIISPYGDVVCEIANSDEGFAKCEINLDLVKMFRSQFDVRRDRFHQFKS